MINLVTCIYISQAAIACINSIAGSENLKCIWEENTRLCVDERADLACYQDTFRENIWEGEDILKNILDLNYICGGGY